MQLNLIEYSTTMSTFLPRNEEDKLYWTWNVYTLKLH